MENKIQELTDKIYREGVEKGNTEAQKLIANAQDEAKKIVEDARKEAEAIVAASRKSADELAENTKSELKLFAGQAVNALKSEIATLVTDKIVKLQIKQINQPSIFVGQIRIQFRFEISYRIAQFAILQSEFGQTGYQVVIVFTHILWF